MRAKAGDVGSSIECGAFNVIDHDDISGLFRGLRRPPSSADPPHIEAHRNAADCPTIRAGCSPSRPASDTLPIQALETS
jgi:hypothetical protein